MPDMDGREMLARLRRERPDQAVLVLSCLADVTTKVACLELGAQDYLTKPFSLDELLARVRVRLRDDGHPLTRCSGPGSWCSTSAGSRPTSGMARCRSPGWSSCCSGS